MKVFQQVVLLLKVLVMLSLGISAAWAGSQTAPGYWVPGHAQGAVQMVAKSESEPGDQGQGGSEGDDDSTTDEPDTDNPDSGSKG